MKRHLTTNFYPANLTPYTKGEERAKENGRKGGIASGRKRRKRKFYNDLITTLVESDIPAKDIKAWANREKTNK